jgi:hypothetical protein
MPFSAPNPTLELSGKMRAAIKDSNLNLAMASAEYRKTADLFSSVAKDVVDAYLHIRKGKVIAGVKRYLKKPSDRVQLDVANRWLQYQYGMKPTLSDLYGSCEALRKTLAEGKYHFKTVSKRSYQSESQRWPQTGTIRGTAQAMASYQMRMVARYRIREAAVKQLAEVGITNPALLAWELIPYSFVVDWLFPVGDWLASLDALVGVSDLTYYSSVKGESRTEGSVYGGHFMQEQKSYQRFGPRNDLPLPNFGYEPSDSLTKVVNGLALLRKLR